MSLSEDTYVDQITVDEFGNTHVRKVTRFKRGDEVLAENYHRHVIEADADLAGEDERVRAIAEAGRQGARPLPPTRAGRP